MPVRSDSFCLRHLRPNPTEATVEDERQQPSLMAESIKKSKGSSESGSFEFEFSSRFSSGSTGPSGSMSSADELFLNGQIRPMKLSTHLQRPQILAPLMDLEGEEEDEESKDGEEFEKREKSVVRGRDLRLRNRSMHRKARSMSPLRNAAFEWHEEPVRGKEEVNELPLDSDNLESEKADTPSMETTPSSSASSSRSSSSGRNSKKWIFLKDLLYRSKSEGRGNSKEKFWSSISFSPSKEKKLSSTSLPFSSSTEEGMGLMVIGYGIDMTTRQFFFFFQIIIIQR